MKQLCIKVKYIPKFHYTWYAVKFSFDLFYAIYFSIFECFMIQYLVPNLILRDVFREKISLSTCGGVDIRR